MKDFAITELDRRLANLIRLGTIAEADYAGALVRVQIGELMTGWLPWLTTRASKDCTWWAPELGEQVLVLSPSGDLAQGMVLMSLYQNAHPAPGDAAGVHTTVYEDGARIEYDRQTHLLKAVLPSGGKAELVADGGISITGDINVTGSVTVSDDVTVTGKLSAQGDVQLGSAAAAMAASTHGTHPI